MGTFVDYRTKETKIKVLHFPPKNGTTDEKRKQFWEKRDGWQL